MTFWAGRWPPGFFTRQRSPYRPPHPPFGHPLPGGEKDMVNALAERKERRPGAKRSPSPRWGEGWGEGFFCVGRHQAMDGIVRNEHWGPNQLFVKPARDLIQNDAAGARRWHPCPLNRKLSVRVAGTAVSAFRGWGLVMSVSRSSIYLIGAALAMSFGQAPSPAESSNDKNSAKPRPSVPARRGDVVED